MIYQYARVSTAQQATSGLGIISQIKEMTTYSSKNHNGKAVSLFTDEGVSGSKSLEQREGLFEAVSLLNKGDTLLAYDMSRLARSTMVMVMLQEEVRKRGATIETVVGSNEDTPEGILMRSILVSLSEYSRTSQNIKISQAIQHKIKAGYKAGSAPFGYRHNEDRTEYIEVDEEQAVIRIAEDFINNDSGKYGFYSRMSCYLNENNAIRRTGIKWNQMSVRATFKRYLK